MNTKNYNILDLSFELKGFKGFKVSLLMDIMTLFTIVSFIELQKFLRGNYEIPNNLLDLLWLFFKLIIEMLIISVIHEEIHAQTYMLLGKFNRDAVKISFCFIELKKTTTVKVRRWTAIMPTIITFIITFIIGIVFNDISMLIISGTSLSFGTSDIYDWYKLKNFNGSYLTKSLDNKKTGCLVYVPKYN